MNKVHGILNTCGIKLKKESLGAEKGLKHILTHRVDEISQFFMAYYFQLVASLH